MRLRPRLSAWTTLAGVFLAVGCLEAARDQTVRKPLGRPAMAVFYVSPNGNDHSSGRWPDPRQNDGPFATVARARDAVRVLLETQKVPRPVRVVLRQGTYTLNKTLEFGPEDSGTKEAPIVYGAAPGERVVLSGGRQINPAAFRPVSDLLARLPKESRGKVLQVDLRAQGITEFGAMRPRGWGHPYVNPGLELFFNDQPMQLARWPNRGMVPVGKVLDPGSAPRDGDLSNRGATFTYDYDRPARWTHANDLWLCGYFAYGYADDTIQVKSIDLAGRTITLARAHRYGVKTGRPFHGYFALNLLEELDEPGEWYLDRSSGLLYLWPPSELRTARISVSLLDAPMVALEGASHIILRGLTFEVSRGMGVYIEGGSGNLITGCTFRNLGTVAVCMGQGIKTDPDGLIGYTLQQGAERGEVVKLEPVSRQLGDYTMALYGDTTWDRKAGTHHGVVGCDITNTGAGGIILGGGDRKTLTPAGNYVLNCHISRFNRLERNGRAAVNIDGVGNRVAHCLIHDAPLGAILLNGNDHVIEFNEIHDVCLEADDMGAFYMGRDPSEQGNILRYNFIHHTGKPGASVYGAYAVYLDDGACGTTVESNVFFKIRTAAVYVHGGHDNIFRNNILVDTKATLGYAFDNRTWSKYVSDPLQVLRLRRAVDILRPPYASRYPRLADSFEADPDYRRGNIMHQNLSVRSGSFGTGSSDDARENLVTDEDPGFVDAAAMNFQLKPDAPIFAKIPGFKRFPFERIGLYADEYRKVLPADQRRTDHPSRLVDEDDGRQ